MTSAFGITLQSHLAHKDTLSHCTKNKSLIRLLNT